MKIYVAGSSADMPRINAAIASLRAAGHEIGCTWPGIVASVGDANPVNAPTSDRAGWSAQDLSEVLDADLVWFLVPPRDVPTRGAWVEAGYALGHDMTVVFSGETKQSVFTALGREFESDAEALEWIGRAA